MATTEEVRRSLALPRSEVEWFEQTYGEGKLSWVVALLLAEFRITHVMSPQDYATLGAKALKMKIEDL